MRATRAAGTADASNKFTSGYGLPLKHVDVREMAVASGETSAMVYDNKLAITVLPTHKRYRSARSSNDRVAPRCFNILARVKFVKPASEWVCATAEPAFQFSNYGPNSRGITTIT